jgi:hypothetical protein
LGRASVGCRSRLRQSSAKPQFSSFNPPRPPVQASRLAFLGRPSRWGRARPSRGVTEEILKSQGLKNWT